MNDIDEMWVGPRWREVEQYASDRNISAGEAVIELINKGLSHVDPD